MKIASKIIILILMGIFISAIQFAIQQIFNTKISKIENAMNQLQESNEIILNGIVEEKKYLAHHSREHYLDVIKYLNIAGKNLSGLKGELIPEIQNDLILFIKLSQKYLSDFNDINANIEKFDKELLTIHTELNGFNQSTLSIIEKTRAEIGLAMINVEQVDENLQNLADMAKNSLLWLQQIDISLNEHLFSNKNEKGFAESMNRTSAALEIEKKNAEILFHYMKNKDPEYGTYLNQTVSVINSLPVAAGRIFNLWKEKIVLEAKLDDVREKMMTTKRAVMKIGKLQTIGKKQELYIYVAVSFFILLIIYFIIGMLMLRSVTKPLMDAIDRISEAAERTTHASEQASSAGHALAQNACEQSTAVEEISGRLTEFVALCHETSNLTHGAMDLMMTNLEKSARSLKSFVDLSKILSTVEEDSDRVSQIIATIDSIAFQTTLLALNAAIESARAGEAGAGFSVVAGEVRNLALESTESAKNTQELLNTIMRLILQATASIKETTDDFGDIIESASVMGEKTNLITVASKKHAAGLDELSLSVQEIKETTQNMAASAEETSVASEELKQMAFEMKNVVANIVQLVRGKKAGR